MIKWKIWKPKSVDFTNFRFLVKFFFLFFLFFSQAEDEYMISDFDLFVSKFISVPKEMGHLNCNAFVAGIVGGVLDGAGFPAR